MAKNRFYQSPEWRDLRALALARDGGRCVFGCGRPANVVDHIATRPDLPHLCEADQLINLRSLCWQCDARIKELPGELAAAAGALERVRRRDGEYRPPPPIGADGWPISTPEPKR